MISSRLGDFFEQRQEPGEEGLPTFSVTMNDGLVLRDELERRTETNLRPHQHLRVRKGDIAYNMMRMWQGACGLADRDGIVSPAYVVLQPRKSLDSQFAYEWFKTPRMIHLFWAYSYGLTEDRLRLYFDEFARIPATPPSLERQKSVAATLQVWNRAIQQVDGLVAAKRKQRLSVLRDLLSQQNNTLSLSAVAQVEMGQSPPSSSYNDIGAGVPLVQGAGDFDEWGVRPQMWTTKAAKKALPGTVIMSVRAPVGAVTRSDREICLGRGVSALITDTEEDAEFLFAALIGANSKWHRLSQGTSFTAVGTDQFDEFQIAWPAKGTRKAVGAMHRCMFEEERSLLDIAKQIRTQKRGLMQKMLTGERLLEENFQ